MRNNIPIYWEDTKNCFKKYAVFSGRSSRQEYIVFCLFIVFVPFLLAIIEGLFGLFPSTDNSILGIIFNLAILIPNLAVTIRRLHDVNRSAWWILINLTIIGIIPFVYWVCMKKSDEGENRFGSNPLTGSEVI
jgi:uncharacterized membrane protein YhaH (DUF805 family)